MVHPPGWSKDVDGGRRSALSIHHVVNVWCLQGQRERSQQVLNHSLPIPPLPVNCGIGANLWFVKTGELLGRSLGGNESYLTGPTSWMLIMCCTFSSLLTRLDQHWISMLVRFGNAKAGVSNGALVVQRLINKIIFKLKLTKIQIRFSVHFVTCLCNQCSFLHSFSHFLFFLGKQLLNLVNILPWLK